MDTLTPTEHTFDGKWRHDGPRWVPLVIAVALIILAALPGIAATKRLSWPYDLDAFRDIAAAQSIRDGARGADPFYAGEAAWYNPLAPALVAAASWVFKLPVSVADVRIGAWINLAAPVTFFAASWWLVGPGAALLALTAFLFLPTDAPAWAAGTYTPWLFPALLAQAFLYIGLVSCAAALRRPTVTLAALCGCVIGVTFLTHTAAAVMLAATLAVSSAWQWHRRTLTGSQALRIVAVAALVSIAISSPFLLPLLFRYRLHVINTAPATWAYDAGFPIALISTLRKPAVWPLVIATIIGAWTLIRRGGVSASVILGWGFVSIALSAYSLAVGVIPSLPAIVPAYHFQFQVRAWGWMLVGVGVWTLIEQIHRLAPAIPWRTAWTSVMVAAAGGLLLYPTYRQRPAFTDAPTVAQRLGAAADRSVSSWLRTSTPRDSVVLATDEDGLLIVAPAGRRVVALDPFFSNPYLSHTNRRDARDRMFTALAKRDWHTFDSLAREFKVGYVLARGTSASALLGAERVQPVFGTSDLTLLRVVN